MTSTDSDQRTIENAVTAWARSIFSAPRRLGELVTNVEQRDEVIERVATQIVRREVREVRTATIERRSTRPRIERGSVDPFAHTVDTLKADSEYIAQCDACAASGLMHCDACHGTGNGRCPNCDGTGKERSAKTGRPIKCKSCKATGAAPCRRCAGNGSVPCRGCAGSGHQLAWLTFEQAERWEVAVPLNSPVVLTHRVLREGRALSPADLPTVTIVEEKARKGPLELRDLAEPERHAVRTELDQIDPRLERVLHQQYLKVAAIRRDVTFEMCGTKATLSLSGTALTGATTPEVMRPITRRLYAWITLCGLVGIVGLFVRGAVVGSSRYFDDARSTSGLLIGVAVACAVPAIGTLLRSWRGGLRFHPMQWPIRAWSAGAVVAFMAIVVVGLVARPTAPEVQRALAVNDVARARSTVDALREQAGATPAVMDLDDGVSLAEAGKLHGDERLQKLDAIAARKGAAAAGAAATARAQRLDEVHQLVATRHTADALAALDKSFANDKSVTIAEERASAHEAASEVCTTAACRLGEAIQAHVARATPERATAIELARARAVEALDPQRIDAKATLPRLQQLRQLQDAAVATTKVALDDADLQTRAKTAIALADSERAKVPLLTNSLAIAEELLGVSMRSPGGVPSIALDGSTVYLALDSAGRCTGIYAVGDKAAAREIKSTIWPPPRLLSQAVGRASVLPVPSAGRSMSRGYAGGAPVVARWSDGALVELRIGDATP